MPEGIVLKLKVLGAKMNGWNKHSGGGEGLLKS